jgi:hypothetical protein
MKSNGANATCTQAPVFESSISPYNVGIGTITPLANLQINGTYAAGTSATLLELQNTTAQAANVYSEIGFKADTRWMALIKAYGVTGTTASLGFFTFSNTTRSSLLERMTILDNGNVGIGITNPTQKLNIVQTSATNNAIVANNTAANTNSISGDAIDGSTSQSGSAAVWGKNTYATGTAIMASGNGGTNTWYLTTGSGGSFTGTQTGVYGIEDDSLVAGVSYANTYAGVYGHAHSRRTSDITSLYHFGVFGLYDNASATFRGGRSGGVLGYLSNAAGTSTWGSLGYLSSGYVSWGGYFESVGSHTNGAGKVLLGANDNTKQGIGFGSYGDLMGGQITGEVYGLTVKGDRYGLYVNGTTYTNNYIARLTTTESGEKVASYVSTSMVNNVYANGVGKLDNGKATVTFDKNFTDIISSEKRVIVTVTPLGESKGIFISNSNSNGFAVSENGSGNSNVEFTWIAIGVEKGNENPVVPSELKTADFDIHLNATMVGENNSDGGLPIWWDGNAIRYDAKPNLMSNRPMLELPSVSRK